MKPPNLLGSRVKLDRAKDLGDALEEKVLTTIGFPAPTNAITTRHGFNEDMTEYRLWVETIPEIEMLMFGVAIGDVIHNIRSALDHVAWELVSCCGTPGLSEDEERAIQFPIYDAPG
ncbi:MAG: hypothetical protein M3273_01575, partial [Actinomycetota bacterium]|nr:hypothetical protein [Actinomycetota bacterium]